MTKLMPWRRTGLAPWGTFGRELEEMMQRFFGEPVDNGGALQAWAPRVDVEETDKEIRVKADLPGVDPKDVEVSVADGMLTLRGEKKEEHEEKKKGYHRLERFRGEFYREIPLPPGADAEKVTATSAQGVITVTVPKRATAQARKVVVKAQG
jgi:HSP20 family protein